MHWVIQNYVFDNIDVLIDCILNNNDTYVFYDDHYKSREQLTIPAIFYGSVNKFNNISFNPGIFYDDATFSCNSYYPKFNRALLNNDFIMLPYGSLLYQREMISKLYGNIVFLRPNSGRKIFTGFSTNINNMEDEFNGLNIDDKTLVVVAPHKYIDYEYRFIIINDEVVTYSSYNSERSVPNEAIEYAKEHCRILAKNIPYVLDICECNYKYYVLEINCINSSGLYDCDHDIFVKELSKFSQRHFDELMS